MHVRTMALLGSLFFMAGCGTEPEVGPVPENTHLAPTSSHASRAYLSSFASGKLTAIDLASERVVGSIDVDDGAGSVGYAVTGDGRTLFVTDGSLPARLRIFDASTLTLKSTYEFANRELQLGIHPRTELTEDERRLVIGTFDYRTLKSGALAFDRLTATFSPVSDFQVKKHTVDVTEVEKTLGAMDDPQEAGSTVWIDATPNGRLLAYVHGSHAWFVDKKTKHAIGSARLPGFGHDARFSRDFESVYTYLGSKNALVSISPSTYQTHTIPLSIPRNGPVDFLIAAAP